MRKLCIRSLQRGVGSMDLIQGLLIMEDDLDEGHEEDESDVTPTPTTSTDLACSSTAGTPDPAPSPSNNAIPWCKCGVCQIMPQEVENKCCGLQKEVQERLWKMQRYSLIIQIQVLRNANLGTKLGIKCKAKESSILLE